MMRSLEQIEKLIQGAGASPRCPMAQMIAATAQKLNTASLEIAGKILIIRDTLDRVEQKRTPGAGTAPPGYEATAEMPELVLTAGPHALCVFTDPVRGAEASALAAEIARDEGRSGIRLDIDARALASASGQLPACQRSPR